LQKRRGAAFILAVLSILSNLEWVTLPFYFFGLRGRSGVIYGRYTLFQTFSFHPAGVVWWVLLGLQVFMTLAIFAGSIGRDRALSLLSLGLPAIALLMLDAYVAVRWNAIWLWKMYVIGAFPGILLLGSGILHSKSIAK
jgi:hypothetical protein